MYAALLPPHSVWHGHSHPPFILSPFSHCSICLPTGLRQARPLQPPVCAALLPPRSSGHAQWRCCLRGHPLHRACCHVCRCVRVCVCEGVWVCVCEGVRVCCCLRGHPLHRARCHVCRCVWVCVCEGVVCVCEGEGMVCVCAAAYVVMHSIVLAATFAGVCGCACVRVWCACVRVWVCVCAAAYVVIHSIVLPATLAGV